MTDLKPNTSAEAYRTPFYVGIDIGGTSIKVGIVDDLGRSVADARIPTQAEVSPEPVVGEIRVTIERLVATKHLQMSDIVAVGVGAPGPIDIPAGQLGTPFNLPGWHHFPICDRLFAALEKPITFANDANAAAFGEYWVGSGRDYNSIVLFTLGTGIGAGIIVNGDSIDGENSLGSECGHMIIDSQNDARICSCGLRGHLEAYTSATSVIHRVNEALQSGKSSSVIDRVAAGEQLSTFMLFEEAEQGDPLSLDIILQTAYYLSIGIVNVLYAVDPGAVFLGGAMDFGGRGATTGKRFLETLRAEVKRRAFPTIAKNLNLEFAALGGAAGYIGAAGIARKSTPASANGDSS